MDELNVPLLRKTMEHIRAHPEHWLQSIYRGPVGPKVLDVFRKDNNPVLECGTAMCFAGWACDLAGVEWRGAGSQVVAGDYSQSCGLAARDLLGLTQNQALILFAGDNKLSDLEEMVEALIDGTFDDRYVGVVGRG